jgi:hypothetical protein
MAGRRLGGRLPWAGNHVHPLARTSRTQLVMTLILSRCRNARWLSGRGVILSVWRGHAAAPGRCTLWCRRAPGWGGFSLRQGGGGFEFTPGRW